MTVREKLIAQAESEAERDLINIWMDEEGSELCARQQAWERVGAHLGRGELRCSW